jgi:DNA-binding response OmpR family regulator
MQLLKSYTPDLIISDLHFDDGDILDEITQGNITYPTMILSYVCDDDTVIKGLTMCIDYCVKPISITILEKRILMHIADKQGTIRSRGLEINPKSLEVFFNGRKINLTSSEFNILYFLAVNKGHIYTAEQIYEHIWGERALNTTTIRYHLYNLRHKLKNATQEQNFIATHFGRGYVFIA